MQSTGYKTNALLALERLEENKKKFSTQLEHPKKKENSFWDSITSIFSPLNCNNE
jgi:hypothetical protein